MARREPLPTHSGDEALAGAVPLRGEEAPRRDRAVRCRRPGVVDRELRVDEPPAPLGAEDASRRPVDGRPPVFADVGGGSDDPWTSVVVDGDDGGVTSNLAGLPGGVASDDDDGRRGRGRPGVVDRELRVDEPPGPLGAEDASHRPVDGRPPVFADVGGGSDDPWTSVVVDGDDGGVTSNLAGLPGGVASDDDDGRRGRGRPGVVDRGPDGTGRAEDEISPAAATRAER
mmetsp:Transcript_26164/g.84687  ORF Transcript_26164/g.84687 Transcript_26164/m.84687 type:complete len:229 (-) Transcript_26164:162-848(-)